MTTSVEPAINQLRSMLSPDGYDLVIAREIDEVVDLRVVAGPDACADCLVPKDVFAQIVAQHLAPIGMELGTLDYPED